MTANDRPCAVWQEANSAAAEAQNLMPPVGGSFSFPGELTEGGVPPAFLPFISSSSAICLSSAALTSSGGMPAGGGVTGRLTNRDEARDDDAAHYYARRDVIMCVITATRGEMSTG